MVLDGASMRMVLEEATSYQAIRGAAIFLTYCERPREDEPVVRVFWGPTGSGKSRTAGVEAAECGSGPDDIYWHPGGSKWWPGYDGHGVAIIDDFRPRDWKFNYLLRLLDRNPLQVEIKGGYRQFRSRFIFITCPAHPDAWYLEEGEDVVQLLRRITEIRQFV